MADRTIKEIYDIIINQLETEYNFKIPLLSKAFSRVVATIFAGVWKVNYNFANWIFLQLFVSTASFKEFTVYGKKIVPLIEWGRLLGLGDPEEATLSRYTADVTVLVQGGNLNSGTQFYSSLTGLNYFTETSYDLDSSTIEIQLVCSEAGLAGNLDVGSELTSIDPIGEIDKTIVITARTVDGVDAETEAEYRSKVENGFSQRPQGGSLVDYRVWGSIPSGVYQIYVFTGSPPTYVLIYVAGDPDIYPNRVPTSSLLLAVGESIDFDTSNGYPLANRRPPGAIIDPVGDKSYTNIFPISNRVFSVEIISLDVDDPADVESRINEGIENYILSREMYNEGLSVPPQKNRVEKSAIVSIVAPIVTGAGGTYDDLRLIENSVVIPFTTLVEGELAILGSVSYVTS